MRGPSTAEKLGLNPTLAITDPALLIRQFFSPPAGKAWRYGFMPHFSHAHFGDQAWKRLCADLGLHFIDARAPIEQVIGEIAQTEILLTEAMHGAIVADALRVPWTPLQTDATASAFKWRDWCLSLGLEHRPYHLHPLWNPPANPGPLTRLRQGIKLRCAEMRMKRIVREARPMLSNEATQMQRLYELETALERLMQDLAQEAGPACPR